MRRLTMCVGIAALSLVGFVALLTPAAAALLQDDGVPRIDLAQQLAAGRLRGVNRTVTRLDDKPGAVHLSEAEGSGLAWVDGTDFGEGAIDVEVRGRDVAQRSFVGVAFHRTDDQTYESVYLRPFNFRSDNPVQHQHAVQYMKVPDFDWPRLREEFPEEFENPVDSSVAPTAWVPLRVVVRGPTIEVYVGASRVPALEARKLGQLQHGAVGLWVGNTSDGDFANLRITAAK